MSNLLDYLFAFYDQIRDEKMWERWIHANTELSFNEFKEQFKQKKMTDEESQIAINRAEAILKGGLG